MEKLQTEKAIPVIEFVERKPSPELVKQWEAEAEKRCFDYGQGVGAITAQGYVLALQDNWLTALPWQEIAGQSLRLFPDCGPAGHLQKLQAEAQEAVQAPQDITEYADCYITLTAAAMKAGFTPGQLVQAIRDKMDVLETRVWEKTPDGAYQHVKQPTVYKCTNPGCGNIAPGLGQRCHYCVHF